MRKRLSILSLLLLGSLALAGGEITSPPPISLSTPDGTRTGTISQTDYDLFKTGGGAAAWGLVTGTLSSQTDLATALGLKAVLGANSFTGAQTITRNGMGNAIPTADGIVVANTTAPTSTVQQSSPFIRWEGRAYRTNLFDPASNKPFAFTSWASGTAGLASKGTWHLGFSDDNATPTDIFSVDYTGAVRSGPQTILSASLQSTPGIDQDSITLRNNAGGGWNNIVFNSSGTPKGAVQTDENGRVYVKGITGFTLSHGPSINNQVSDIVTGSNGIETYGTLHSGGSIKAGNSQSTTPAVTTLDNFGSYGPHSRQMVVSGDVLASDNKIFCDSRTSFSCEGTPTACSIHSSQSACDSHSAVGCLWASGGDCSSANGSDSTTCTNQSPSCQWDQASCSAYNDDASGCGANPTCSFTPTSCSTFTDQFSCDEQASNGCTTNSTDCTTLDAGSCYAAAGSCTAATNECSTLSDAGSDGSACGTQPGNCSYDSDTGNCSGTSFFTGCSGPTFFVSCSGTHSTLGTCGGVFPTGNCSGGAFGTCGGSAQCSNITDTTACSPEGGCSLANKLNMTLPPIDSATNAAGGVGQELEFTKIDNEAGSCRIEVSPTSGDRIEGGLTGLTITQYGIDGKTRLYPLIKTTACSSLPDESSCDPHSPECVWDGSACTGRYVSDKLWMK